MYQSDLGVHELDSFSIDVIWKMCLYCQADALYLQISIQSMEHSQDSPTVEAEKEEGYDEMMKWVL